MNASQHEPTYTQENLEATAPWRVVPVCARLVNVTDVFHRPVLAIDHAEPGTANGVLATHIAMIPMYSRLVGYVIAGMSKEALALAHAIADDVEVMS